MIDPFSQLISKGNNVGSNEENAMSVGMPWREAAKWITPFPGVPMEQPDLSIFVLCAMSQKLQRTVVG